MTKEFSRDIISELTGIDKMILLDTWQISGVYMIFNKFDEKCNIGSSVNIFERLVRHVSDLEKNVHHSSKFQNAWNKHGKSSFLFKILEKVERQDGEIIDDFKKRLVYEKEQYYLDTLLFANCDDDRFKKLGYNICRKADSCLGIRWSDESKIKSSISRRGKPSPRKGAILSDYTKDKIRKANIGLKQSAESIKKRIDTCRLNGVYDNFKCSEETKEKLRQYKGDKSSFWMKSHTEETKQKMIDNSTSTRSVQQFDLTGNILNSYISMQEAYRETKISSGAICNACKGKYKTAGGFIWKYKYNII